MTSLQLCQLFEHCHIYNLGGFIFQNKLTGTSSLLAIPLLKCSLNKIIYLHRNNLGIHLEDGIENIRDLTDLGLDKLNAKVLLKRIDVWKVEGLPLDFCSSNNSSPSMTATADPSTSTEIVQKQLDVDFASARYCRDRAATDRIVASADAGNHLAQAYLSILYDRKGTLVETNRHKAEEYATKAISWLKKNASSGNNYVLYNMALCYCDGRGVEQSDEEAVRYAKLAADQNHAASQAHLGFCYHFGKGVIQNYSEAVRYFKLAADQGYAEAQFYQGFCYTYGTGVVKNDKEAARYFKLAADQGYAVAQYWLAVRFEYGRGVTKDRSEALRLYELAADQEYKPAVLRLETWFYDGVD